MNRRKALLTTAGALAGAASSLSVTPRSASAAAPSSSPAANAVTWDLKGKILKAVKYSMIQPKDLPPLEMFKISLDCGFDGITLQAPGYYDLKEVLAAQDKTGIPIHNINVADHWQVRLTDADPEVRKKALQNTIDAIKFTHDVGGSSVLQVIGKVTDPETENHDQVWQRSTEMLMQAIPVAAELGVMIACENVGNDFCYDAAQWREYLEAFDSPWVGAFFDIGNMDSRGGAPHWIRTLGGRLIQKLDVKDHITATQKNCNLFDGDVDWPDVRKALQEVHYAGWATAEVQGGDAARLTQVAERMDKALGLV